MQKKIMKVVKVGDIIKCIDCYKYKNDIWFYAGCWYEVSSIGLHSIEIYDEAKYTVSFSLFDKKTCEVYVDRYFTDYFYTEKELRKIKLKKLNILA